MCWIDNGKVKQPVRFVCVSVCRTQTHVVLVCLASLSHIIPSAPLELAVVTYRNVFSQQLVSLKTPVPPQMNLLVKIKVQGLVFCYLHKLSVMALQGESLWKKC